jgi:hypothetical protein
MMEEDNFLKALAEINSLDFGKKKWLVNYFELYKTTLIWPENLPPINRSNLIKETLRGKFNSIYKELLSEFEYKLNNEKQSLEIKSTNR